MDRDAAGVVSMAVSAKVVVGRTKHIMNHTEVVTNYVTAVLLTGDY